MATAASVVGLDGVSIESAGLGLNSFTFVLIGAAAVLACRLAHTVNTRAVLLLLLNIYFLHFFIGSARQALVLGLFLSVVYVLGNLKVRVPAWRSSVAIAAIVCAFWTFLFLVKDEYLFSAANPFAYFPVKLVGISYIVFRAISYVMEAELAPKAGLLGFLNYMLFFPTLLAGPIERYTRFAGNHSDLAAGRDVRHYPALNRILNGFIKKFVLADNLMVFGIFALSQEGEFSIWLLWAGALAMLFLIYLDFSGYCDIVIGLAQIMGFRIGENFNRPFTARNVQDFWSRWHVSLSSLIQDYVFTPLNKAVIGRIRGPAQFPLIVTVYLASMVLVAMWHGTTLGFLVFGTMHGAALVVLQLKRRYRWQWIPGARPRVRLWGGAIVAPAITYCFISLSLIWWFRDLPHAVNTFKQLLGMG
ncbi:MAG: MBOAT family protein [Burkholderiales bacterium]|nr:MBOAT family protein [Burkholderiales bacterium]